MSQKSYKFKKKENDYCLPLEFLLSSGQTSLENKKIWG